MLRVFFYLGYTKKGELKFGLQRHQDLKSLRSFLNAQQIFIKRIYALPNIIEKSNKKELLIFFTQTRILLKNHYSFSRIIELLSENKMLSVYATKIGVELKKGNSLYNSLKKSGLHLKNSDLMIIKAGEESGNIYYAFCIIEKQLLRTRKLKKDLKKLMLYPSITFFLTIILVIFIGKYIMPDFVKTLTNSSLQLPTITKIVIYFSNNSFYFLIILVILIFSIKICFKKTKFRYFLFNFLIKFNFIKNMLNKFFILHFISILKELFSSGITITESIEIIKKELKYDYFISKLDFAEDFLKKGNTIHSSFKTMNIFSKLDLELLKLGEESGELENIFSTIKDNLNIEFEEKINIALKLIGPFSILILGIFIGSIFIGMYLPVFQIMDSI